LYGKKQLVKQSKWEYIYKGYWGYRSTGGH